jgi:hypothetical protein
MVESDRLGQPSGVERFSRCRVERWRGYVSSSFYALTETGEVLESPTFRWRRADPPPEDGAARAAYDSLVERLLAEGWEPEATGQTWYATTFVRRTFEPQPVAVEAPPQPAPPRRPAPQRAARPPVAAPPPTSAAPTDSAPPAPAITPRRSGRRRVMLVGALAGVVAFAGVAVVTAGRSADTSRSPAAKPAPAVKAPAAKPGAVHRSHRVVATATPAAPRHVTATTFRLGIAAHSTTWLEIRRGSKTGPVLYSGNLSPGRTLHFRGSRLWGRFGAAGNLTITQDGRLVPLQGTYDRLFVVRRSR